MQARLAATTSIPIRSDADLAWVRQQVRQAAADIGLSLVQQTKLITAASELARNTLVHGGGGSMDLNMLDNGQEQGVQASFTDEGPGIRDIETAMTDGYTTGGGLGLGLSGAKRLVQDFHIDSRPGQGTTVTIAVWVTSVPSPRPGAG
jgi:serine/threonine-protein kinase RsbT